MMKSSPIQVKKGLNPQGHLLADVGLALVVVFTGAFMWGLLKNSSSVPIKKDASALCVWLQNESMALLLRHGLRDEDILSSHTALRREGSFQWLEHQVNINTPPLMSTDAFYKDLENKIKEQQMRVQSFRQNGDTWLIEIGQKHYVYGRFVFHLSEGQKPFDALVSKNKKS